VVDKKAIEQNTRAYAKFVRMTKEMLQEHITASYILIFYKGFY
jgi:hypothetical protein